jgi:D-3-phosphoglycerate dehydrogenase
METETVENLVLDLLEWVGVRERPYEEVIEAWRTSCPRLPVWEEANDRGLLTVDRVAGISVVRLTGAGRALLEDRRSRQ